MTDAISYAQACVEPALFGDWFNGPTWATWAVFDKAIFGELLSDDELAIFKELTGRDSAPTEKADEVWMIIGRRGGKDIKASSIAVYLATIGVERYGWRERLKSGETGVVQLLAADREQAKVAFRYIARGFMRKPVLAAMIERQTADTIELSNGFAIQVTTADQRTLRGRTLIAAILDEVAHWYSDNSTTADVDIYDAIKPSMATMPGAMIIGISSPYARRGLLYKKFQKSYGQLGKTLVIKAPTWRMNPLVPFNGTIIGEAYKDDPDSASAEYGAEFRSDIESLIGIEAVHACVDQNVRERPPERQHNYYGFCDPSGGSADSMTLAIAHKEGSTAVLDCVREAKPPFSPEAVTAEFSGVLRNYRLSEVTGDRYAGEWVAEAFRGKGIHYQHSEKPKSGIYLDMLPLINSKACALLDHERMVRQLVGLERRVGRGTGRDIIDHSPGQHDDIANAVAGAVTLAASGHVFNAEDNRKWQFTPRKIA